MTLEEVRKLLEEAMDFHSEHWLEEAVRRLESQRHSQQFRRIYDITTVGARIRTARETVGLTQHQLARRMGWHPWAVSNLETGRRNLDAQKLPGLATCLMVSRAWLLMESDEGGPPLPTKVLRKQKRVNWQQATAKQKKKARAKAELERLRGLRPPKETKP